MPEQPGTSPRKGVFDVDEGAYPLWGNPPLRPMTDEEARAQTRRAFRPDRAPLPKQGFPVFNPSTLRYDQIGCPQDDHQRPQTD